MISDSEMSVVNKESALEVGWEGKEGLFKNLKGFVCNFKGQLCFLSWMTHWSLTQSKLHQM